jgi:hypothetical protein
MAIEPGPQFYHGTHVDFNPGDVVKPRAATGANPNFDPEPGFNEEDRAYASDHPASALFYGVNSTQRNSLGFDDAKVYHVEPIDPKDVELDKEGSVIMGNAFSSKSGFRVVKRHEHERK